MNTISIFSAPNLLVMTGMLTALSTAILLALLAIQFVAFWKQRVGVMLLHYHPGRLRRQTCLADNDALEKAALALEGQLIQWR